LIATNLTFIFCVYKEKIVKTTHTKERSVHTNSESCKIQHGSQKNQFNSKQIIQILRPIILDNFSTHSYIVIKKPISKILWNINYIRMRRKIIDYYCLQYLNDLFGSKYDPSWMLQLSEFVRTLRSSAWGVFNDFFLIDATDRRIISNYQKRLFFAVSLYPLLFSTNTLFRTIIIMILIIILWSTGLNLCDFITYYIITYYIITYYIITYYTQLNWRKE